MPPRLRVLAGTSTDTMVPITSLVNASKAHRLSSDLFQGEIVVNIKGLTDPEGRVKDSEYFGREDRQGITWSIQVQGRFMNTHSADDILFGNIFDRPLKLPWGSGAAFKFMHFIDPTLEHDLTSSTKPWALSPLISTMPHFMHTHVSPPFGKSPASCFSMKKRRPPTPGPPFPPPRSVTDDTSQLYLALRDTSSSNSSLSSSASSLSISSTSSGAHSYSSATSHSSSKPKMGHVAPSQLKQAIKTARRRRTKSSGSGLNFETACQRRSYFSTPSHRRAIQFGPEDVITIDFCYGFLEFNPSLALRLPGGLSFDLMRYWDGQPVKFICCLRKDAFGSEQERDEDPWGTVFWCVSIEMADDSDDSHEN